MIGRMPFPFVAARGFVQGAARRAMAPGGECVPFHRHGAREEGRVALTFDDGPSAATDLVLERLRLHGARATFFVVGNRIHSFRRVVRQAGAEGHEVGNHSWNHRLRGDWFTDLCQIAVTSAQIRQTIGVEPRLFRPPHGLLAPGLARTAYAAGLAAICWDVDPRDWCNPEPDTLVESVLAEARGGSIVLLHDGPQMTPARVAAALDGLLPRLAAQGLECVTVSELFDGQLDRGAAALAGAQTS
jgi:peptidoglycan/xylan/chitin deacetylase (PgdA/CDA1 family)